MLLSLLQEDRFLHMYKNRSAKSKDREKLNYPLKYDITYHNKISENLIDFLYKISFLI